MCENRLDLEKVNEFFRRVWQKFRLRKVEIFGSSATRKFKEHSYIDLIIVSDIFEGQNLLKRPLYLNFEYLVDFIYYVSKEFEKLGKMLKLVSEVLKYGEIVEFGDSYDC